MKNPSRMTTLVGLFGLAIAAAPAVTVRAQTIKLNDPGDPTETPSPEAAASRDPAVSAAKKAAATASRDRADRSTKNIEGAAEGLAPPGGVFGVSDQTAPTDQLPDEAPLAGPAAEFHVVNKGDTLWTLCERYYQNAWRWPKLWAQNPLITNPHWIFPGDVVRLRAAAGPADTAVATAATPDPGAGGLGLKRKTQAELDSVLLRSVGYVEAHDLSAAAVISGSREEKIMLSTGDQTYLTYNERSPLRAGERYTLFEADTEHPVRDPQTGRVLGYLVRIHGDVVVDQIADKTLARGTLVDMTAPVERGYLISPQVKQFKRIEPRPSAVNLDMRIIASFHPGRLLGPYTFVVLSRGKNAGIEVGNRTFIVRRGDGARRILEDWDKFDPRFPKEVVGEILVVDVRETTSLAWISRGSKEVRVGETVEMRKGH